jgi:hypothetical protein
VRFDSACSLVESALTGGVRRDVVAAAAAAPDARTALSRVRDQMRSHRWTAGAARIALDALVGDYDARTRRDGLHVLHDWDGKADHVNSDPIAVDVATFLVDRCSAERPDPRALAILVDYYFLYLLALLVVRVWDDGDADVNFDRVGRLLESLQGPNGSGVAFISDAETLLLIAGSHYERQERGYDALLARVRGLGVRRRRRIALTHAASLGSHLRFGIEATYNRDIGAMRDDNGVDYTWLCFSLATLVEAWREARDTGDASAAAGIAEAIANGLSADADAFLSRRAPSVLAASDVERQAFRDGLGGDVAAWSDVFAPSRPVDGVYSPIAFFFNFSHNVLKGTVVDATLWGDPRDLSLNDLFTGLPRDPAIDRRKLRLVDTLMEFARTNPDRIHGRLMPVIVYDVVAGRRAFGALTRAIQGIR